MGTLTRYVRTNGRIRCISFLQSNSPHHSQVSLASFYFSEKKRREFDCSHLSFDVNDKPTCSEIDLQIAQRYRSLLYTTQNFAVTKLSKSGGNLSKSHNLYLFCTKIIAINYFRIKVTPVGITY